MGPPTSIAGREGPNYQVLGFRIVVDNSSVSWGTSAYIMDFYLRREGLRTGEQLSLVPPSTKQNFHRNLAVAPSRNLFIPKPRKQTIKID